MSVSFKYLKSYFTKNATQFITHKVEEYILDSASLWRKQYALGIPNFCAMVYGAHHSFLFADSNLTHICGFPTEIIDHETGYFLIKLLPEKDKLVHMSELYLMMKHLLRNKQENMVYRAKIKVNRTDGKSLWVLCEVPLIIEHHDKVIANVSMMHDFSTTKKDDFHKYYYIDADTGEVLYQNYHPSSSINRFRITRKEIQIINLLADGFSSGEIADKLFVQTETIRKHRKNIIQKLSNHIKVRNTPHIVKFACQHGIIVDNSEFNNLWQKKEYESSFNEYQYK